MCLLHFQLTDEQMDEGIASLGQHKYWANEHRNDWYSWTLFKRQ